MKDLLKKKRALSEAVEVSKEAEVYKLDISRVFTGVSGVLTARYNPDLNMPTITSTRLTFEVSADDGTRFNGIYAYPNSGLDIVKDDLAMAALLHRWKDLSEVRL